MGHWQDMDIGIDGSVQECGISSANALEIPQSCTKPLLYNLHVGDTHFHGHHHQEMNVCLFFSGGIPSIY